VFGPMGGRAGLPLQIHDGENVVEGCGTDLHWFSGVAVATARS
jgi:hypothetical protein